MDRRGVVFWGSSSQAVTGDCEPRRDTTTPPSHPSSMKEVEKESNMSKQDPQHHLVLPKNPRLEGYFGLHLFIGKKKKTVVSKPGTPAPVPNRRSVGGRPVTRAQMGGPKRSQCPGKARVLRNPGATPESMV